MQNISRLIGIDYGSKNIGIAISDATLTIASPFCIIKNFSLKRSALEILEISKKNNVSMLILGLPINMDGSLGEMSKVVYKFIDTIKCFSNIAIETVDERLTTVQAEKMLINDCCISRNKRKNIRDKISAAFILQIYLNKYNFL